jgi:hypothetical protein
MMQRMGLDQTNTSDGDKVTFTGGQDDARMSSGEAAKFSRQRKNKRVFMETI